MAPIPRSPAVAGIFYDDTGGTYSFGGWLELSGCDYSPRWKTASQLSSAKSTPKLVVTWFAKSRTDKPAKAWKTSPPHGSNSVGRWPRWRNAEPNYEEATRVHPARRRMSPDGAHCSPEPSRAATANGGDMGATCRGPQEAIGKRRQDRRRRQGLSRLCPPAHFVVVDQMHRVRHQLRGIVKSRFRRAAPQGGHRPLPYRPATGTRSPDCGIALG